MSEQDKAIVKRNMVLIDFSIGRDKNQRKQ